MLLRTSLLLLGASLALASESPSRVVIEERDLRPNWLPTNLPTWSRPDISAPSSSYTFSRNRFRKPCQYSSYTAIGDSYSAGLNYGAGLLPACSSNSTAPCNGGDVCLRNQESFPMYMQAAHNFSSFQFLACSGANTSECQTNQVQTAAYGRPDLVTLTIGGDNNQAFLGLIVNCVYNPNPMFCMYAIANAQQTVATIDSSLTSLFQSIINQNWSWRRRVVVVGYPKLFSTTNSTTCQSDTLAAVDMDTRQQINNLGDAINNALKTAVRRFGWMFTYADADPLYEGHRLCDADPDIFFQFDIATAYLGVFHPTVSGQQALFQAVDQASGCAARGYD